MWQRVSELDWTEHLTKVPYPSATATCLRMLLKWFLTPTFCFFLHVQTVPWLSQGIEKPLSLGAAPLSGSWPCADSYTELNMGWRVLLSPAEPWGSSRPMAPIKTCYWSLCFMALSRGLSLKDYLGSWLSVKHAVPAMFSCLGQIPFVGVRRRSSSSGVTWIPISTGSDTFLSSAREEGGGLLLSMLFS